MRATRDTLKSFKARNGPDQQQTALQLRGNFMQALRVMGLSQRYEQNGQIQDEDTSKGLGQKGWPLILDETDEKARA